MTATIKTALVIGGGFSGMTAAIALHRKGVAVDLIEIDPDWQTYGAGISLGGATFRLLDSLGLMAAFRQHGATTDGIDVRGPGDAVVAKIPTPAMGKDIPGSGGIMRPALAKILADTVHAEGVSVRKGVTYSAIDQTSGHVAFTDGTAGDYDLIVAADGFASSVRRDFYPDAPKPRYVGQAVWRAVLPRPAELPTVTMWMGPKLKAGINPVSATHSYLFLTEDRPVNAHVDPATFVDALKALLGKFPSPLLARVAAGLDTASQINYRPLENMMLPRPWSRGKIVLIGDAVHATTPHLASGAMMGMEDGVVLAEEIAAKPTLADALAAFEQRRFDRCKMVVENSGRLAQIEIEGGSHEEHNRIMGASMGALARPI